MGSGTTGKACAIAGCKFIGIEKDPTYYEVARAEIAEAYLQRPMLTSGAQEAAIQSAMM
jgi:DNA modification methylase